MSTPPEQLLEAERPRLLGVAYRMLDSLSEAEDVVQEACLRWHDKRPDDLREAGAWLTTVTVRLALDQLRSARTRREQYVGPWLPDPLPTDDPDPFDEAARREDLSLALLLALEALGPMERAAFLLHDVFEYPFADIADTLETSPANCRQLASRARRKLKAERPALQASRAELDRLFDTFAAACAARDLDGLLQVLSDDAVLLSDGGGKALAALNPLFGADAVARFLIGIAGKAPAGLVVRRQEINDAPAMVGFVDDEAIFTMSIDVAVDGDGGRIRRVLAVRNPDKLAHLTPPG